MGGPLFAGVDVGASRTKVVLIDRERRLLGYDVRRSGTDFARSAEEGLAGALAMGQGERASLGAIVSCGYGRKNVPFGKETRTEIACHAKGCFHHFPFALTLVDIGGQDNKVIKIDAQGRRLSFKMNRKCAAGTGAFLEEMALRLAIPLEEMNALAVQADRTVELGSYCTVFTATEVLEKIRQGAPVAGIVKGLFLSVIKRIVEMEAFSDRVVVTGGVVAHNPYLAVMLGETISREVLVPPHPQLTGALGAALFALDLGADTGKTDDNSLAESVGRSIS